MRLPILIGEFILHFLRSFYFDCLPFGSVTTPVLSRLKVNLSSYNPEAIRSLILVIDFLACCMIFSSGSVLCHFNYFKSSSFVLLINVVNVVLCQQCLQYQSPSQPYHKPSTSSSSSALRPLEP